MNAAIFIEQLLNGVTLGGVYALIALGYTLVYGVLMMINFAHSELFMLGGVIGWVVLTLVPGGTGAWGISAAFLVSMIAVGGVAVLLDQVAYKPVRGASRLTPLISAIGASLFLQNAVFLWRDSQMTFPQGTPLPTWRLGAVDVSALQLGIVVTSLGLMAALSIFIRRSRLGKAMRAVAQDATTAALLGIPVNRVIALTFFIGGALGGAAGLLNGLYYGSVKYNMGFLPGVKAFTAAVLGGIGSVPGAVLGGFILGIIESLGAAFLPESEWKDVLAFAVLFVVLIFRPSGLLGEKVTDKV